MNPPLLSTPAESGVLLFNLGGPERLEDVRPFLYNLFSDPDIIRIRNTLLRHTVAWLISTARQAKSRALYREIGGGSPLRRITEGQAAALEERLRSRGISARVYVGMRCWTPTIDEAIGRIATDQIRRLVVLPLFPQFSLTTTGSCLNYFHKRLAENTDFQADLATIKQWPDEPLYVEAMTDLIREAMKKFTDRDPAGIHLLYSAHSIPESYVRREGDPYLEQTRRTTECINARLGHRSPFTLAFQSKVGPVKWLEPSTREVLADMGRRGIRRVLVVPISFVSDHIETLQEIDFLYRKLALGSGIQEFHRAESLNLNPKFIGALETLVVRALSNGRKPSHPKPDPVPVGP